MASLLTIGISFVVFLAIFLVCREVVCWYWKINDGMILLTEIRDLLKKQTGPDHVIMETTQGDSPRCEICGYKAGPDGLMQYEGMNICPDCFAFKNT